METVATTTADAKWIKSATRARESAPKCLRRKKERDDDAAIEEPGKLRV